jgi:hypothetical protein
MAWSADREATGDAAREQERTRVFGFQHRVDQQVVNSLEI